MTSINIPIVILFAVALLLVLIIGRKKPDYLIQFFLRVGLCYVAIYFINNALLDKGIEMYVAMNAVTFLVCGFLGFPGLFLLYGMLVWGYFM